MSFIPRVVAHHLRRGRAPDCGVIVWLQAQEARLEGLTGNELAAEEDAIRTELVQHEGWLPLWSYEAVLVSAAYPAARRSAVQAIYVQDIVDAADATLAGRLLTLGGSLCSNARAMLQTIAGA